MSGEAVQRLNAIAGPQWERRRFLGVQVIDAVGILDGMARGEWAVSPDAHDEDAGLPVGVTHLASGLLIAVAHHGAEAMEIADMLTATFPKLFLWPWDLDALDRLIPQIQKTIAAVGGIPTIER